MNVMKEAPILDKIFSLNLDRSIDLKNVVLKKMYHFYTYTHASTVVEEFNLQVTHFYKLEYIEFKKQAEKKHKTTLVQKYVNSLLHKNILESIHKFSSAKYRSVDKPALHTFAPISHEIAGQSKLQRLTHRYDNLNQLKFQLRNKTFKTEVDETLNTIEGSLNNIADNQSMDKDDKIAKKTVRTESISIYDNIKSVNLQMLRTRKSKRRAMNFSTLTKINDTMHNRVGELRMNNIKNDLTFIGVVETKANNKDDSVSKKDMRHFITSIFNSSKSSNLKTNLLIKELIRYYLFFKKFSKKTDTIDETDFAREYKGYGIDENQSAEMFKLIAKAQHKIDFKQFIKYFKPNINDCDLDSALSLMKKIMMIEN